ncbi:GIY-YIG nuclease family protein [Alkaliphilus crotonatoxidans]
MEISQTLKEQLSSIPPAPGVYFMKDRQGNIIYIGKSKSLKSRVRSYFYTEHQWNKIKRMVFHIYEIEYIVTDTHLEAQLLECSLIKELKPPYNSQFKNDRGYQYLKIERNPGNHPLAIVTEREDDHCIGPFRSKHILGDVADFFRNIYPITRGPQGYDFTYHFLPQMMDTAGFEKNRSCLLEIFSAEQAMEIFLKVIEAKMKKAAVKLHYEQALYYKNMMDYLKYLKSNPLTGVNSGQEPGELILGERLKEGYKVFYIANDGIVLKRRYARLSKRAVAAFIREAQNLAPLQQGIDNEKARIDFKQIIEKEIKDLNNKTILKIDKFNDIETFITNLREKSAADL